MQQIFFIFVIILYIFATFCCNNVLGVKELSKEEGDNCMQLLSEVSSIRRGEIFDEAWMSMNRMERAEVMESIARVEGEVLSADEILQLTLAGSNERIIASKNEIVSCTSSLLVHSLEKIWNFLPEEEKEEILYEIASAL